LPLGLPILARLPPPMTGLMSRLLGPADEAPEPSLDLRSGLIIGTPEPGGGRFISQLAINSRTLLALELTSDPLETLRSTGFDLKPESSSSNSRPSGLPRCLNPLSSEPVIDPTGAVNDLSAAFFLTSSIGRTFPAKILFLCSFSSSSSSSNSLQLSLLELNRTF
jgi:hypothetical protein